MAHNQVTDYNSQPTAYQHQKIPYLIKRPLAPSYHRRGTSHRTVSSYNISFSSLYWSTQSKRVDASAQSRNGHQAREHRSNAPLRHPPQGRGQVSWKQFLQYRESVVRTAAAHSKRPEICKPLYTVQEHAVQLRKSRLSVLPPNIQKQPITNKDHHFLAIPKKKNDSSQNSPR